MLKCPIHELPSNIVVNNFYARLFFMIRIYWMLLVLDHSCMKEEAK
jgi:hypothetical protein